MTARKEGARAEACWVHLAVAFVPEEARVLEAQAAQIEVDDSYSAVAFHSSAGRQAEQADREGCCSSSAYQGEPARKSDSHSCQGGKVAFH